VRSWTVGGRGGGINSKLGKAKTSLWFKESMPGAGGWIDIQDL